MTHEAPRTPSRREFLSGKAAADALVDLTSGVDESAASASGASRPAPAVREPYLLHFGRRAMACEFELLVPASQHSAATESIVAAFDLIDRLEAQLSVYRESSEVSQLNRAAADGWIQVEPRLFDLLQLAARLFAETEHAFDITSGPLTKVWGFSRRAGAIPTAADLADALNRVGSRHIEFDETSRAIRFGVPGVELNLGSIGKGYALDRAAEALTAAGVTDFVWHGGQSSVLARGSHSAGAPDSTGWKVGLLDPLRGDRRLAEISLRDRALGTSGAGLQFFRHEGRRYGHILDPRTGWPAEGVLSATALAPTAALADALATAFYVLGVEATERYCASHPEIGAVLTHQAAPGKRMECAVFGLGDAEIEFLPRPSD